MPRAAQIVSLAVVVAVLFLGGLALLLSLTERTPVTAVAYGLLVGLPGIVCAGALVRRCLCRMSAKWWGLKAAGLTVSALAAATALGAGSLFLPMTYEGRHIGNIMAAYLWGATAALAALAAMLQVASWALVSMTKRQSTSRTTTL